MRQRTEGHGVHKKRIKRTESQGAEEGRRVAFSGNQKWKKSMMCWKCGLGSHREVSNAKLRGWRLHFRCGEVTFCPLPPGSPGSMVINIPLHLSSCGHVMVRDREGPATPLGVSMLRKDHTPWTSLLSLVFVLFFKTKYITSSFCFYCTVWKMKLLLKFLWLFQCANCHGLTSLIAFSPHSQPTRQRI